MPKSVTYTAQNINDNLSITFYLAGGAGSIDERARCDVQIVATPDDPGVQTLQINLTFADLENLGTFAAGDWSSLKSLLAKVRNQAVADAGL